MLLPLYLSIPLQWRPSGRDCVSNHQFHDCLHNRWFRRRSKRTSKLRVTGLCVGNSLGTGEFLAQMASNAGNVSFWWRHHVYQKPIVEILIIDVLECRKSPVFACLQNVDRYAILFRSCSKIIRCFGKILKDEINFSIICQAICGSVLSATGIATPPPPPPPPPPPHATHTRAPPDIVFM